VAALTRTLLVALLVLSIAAHASAQVSQPARSEAERLVDDARRLYTELEFVGAVDAAQRALAAPDAREIDRAAALETLGSALIVLDREARAREAFEALFRIDPYWVVTEPSGSPRIRRFVESVRGRVVPDAALDPDVSLRLDLPRAAHSGRSTRVRIELAGRSAEGARVRVIARGDGELEWQTIDASRDGDARFAADLPAHGAAEEIELYAELRDAEGRVVARAGGPLAPYRLPVRAGEGSGSLLDEWWLWAAIGGAVVVIGAGIAIGVAASGNERAPEGTLPPGASSSRCSRSDATAGALRRGSRCAASGR
jgi:hypothetical protein